MSSPLAWFGLPDDADERTIKRAYAQRLKSVRPDADPAGFQQLHDMYRQALAWSQRQATPASPGMEPPSPPMQGGDDAPTPHDMPPADAAHVPPSGDTPPATQPPLPGPRIATLPAAPPSSPHPPASTLPRPPATDGRPLPPRPAFSASQALTSQFDMDVFMADVLEVAIHQDARSVQAWLEQRQELWSLHLKHEAGRAVLQRLFRDPPPIDTANVEAMLAFFGLDHALTGVDPLQMMQLREAMQQRHALVRRMQPAVQPWGANRRLLDVPAFFAWFCQLAMMGEDDALAATMSVQPALLSLAVRQRVAPRLLERLQRELPPMPQACTGLLLNAFGLGALLAQANQPPGELVARLHMQWLMLPSQTGKLVLQVKEPTERYGDPGLAKRQLHWLQRPFRWWWIVLSSLVPKRLYRLGLFAWRLSGGVPPRLDHFFNGRLTRFCIATADRTRITWPRVLVGAIRCVAALLACAALNAWTLRVDAFPHPGDAWLPLMLGGGIAAGWLYYLGFTALRLWQQRPEEPVQPRPLLRMGLIPALIAAGLALAFGVDQLVAAQAVLITAAGLAYTRYRQRNPRGKATSAAGNLVVLVYLLAMVSWVVLRYPAVTAGIALFYWVLDLASQRKQLRFRYRPADDGSPVPDAA